MLYSDMEDIEQKMNSPLLNSFSSDTLLQNERFPSLSYSNPIIQTEWELPQLRKASIQLPSLKELKLLPTNRTRTNPSTELPTETSLEYKKYHNSDPTQGETKSFIIIQENNLSCSRNQRWKVSKEQLKVLNNILQKTHFPSSELRNQLASQLGLSPRTIQIWFQNKRQAWKYKYGIGPPLDH